jgi:serine/threonine protein phosphatase PrpC
VVYDGSEPIAFGRPCFWKAGIAARVLQNELRVETVEVQGLDEEEELLDEIESAESASFKVVYHQSYGARKDQEDRYMCKEYLDGISYISFFGVYDGHGGAEAAEYLHQHLHINFAEALRRQVLVTVLMHGILYFSFVRAIPLTFLDGLLMQHSNNSGRRPYRGRLAQALRTAFRRTDEALLSYCRSKETANTCKEESSGAAAVVAILMVSSRFK